MVKENVCLEPIRRTSLPFRLLPVARDATAAIEAVVSPVPVQAPALAVLVEIRKVAVAVRVHHECAESHPCHHPLNVLGVVSYSES